MGRVGVAAAAAVLAISGAVSTAGPVAAQGQSAGGGPSLEATLGFIRDKLSQEGQLSYSSALHDSADGRNWSNNFTVEATNVQADLDGCRVTYHWRTTNNGNSAYDGEAGVPFRIVTRVEITSMSEDLDKSSADAGHATWKANVTPPISVLTAYRDDGKSNVMDFRDRAMAQRVANAMRHAAELCGGGAKKEPF
jgi:hypothetical protein